MSVAMRWPSAFLLVTLLATSASAVTLCRGKRGPVNVREACKKAETPLTVDALGVTAPPGASGGQGATGSPAVFLVDATGVEVGPVLDVSATGSNNQVSVSVLFRHASLPGPALLAVTGDGRIGNVVYYESTDCTGAAYIELEGWLPILHGVQDTVYIPGPATPGELLVQSLEYSDPQNSSTGCPVVTARGSCCAPINSMRRLLTTTTTTLGALGLTTPFRAVTR